MNPEVSQRIVVACDRLEEGMLDYMSSDPSAYSTGDVDECVQIVQGCLATIGKTKTRDDCMTVVETTVVALNALNQRCGHRLIETDQREDICEAIILAGSAIGYNGEDEDITEEWREW